MHANAGDHILIRGHRVGDREQDCTVVEVLGADGEPPYRVRWDDSGQEGFFFPGSDAHVVPQHDDRRPSL